MRAAVKWGGLIGLSAYLIARLGLTLLSNALFGAAPADANHPGPFSLACLGIFALLFAFSAAGYFTGRDTLRDGLGAVAAIVAMAVYTVLSLIYTPMLGVASSTLPAASTGAGSNPAGQAIATVLAGLIVFGFAALMGWLGGRPGAANARRRLAARPQ